MSIASGTEKPLLVRMHRALAVLPDRHDRRRSTAGANKRVPSAREHASDIEEHSDVLLGFSRHAVVRTRVVCVLL
jgi:hypothetical protein